MRNQAKLKELINQLSLPDRDRMLQGISDSTIRDFQERTGLVLPLELSSWLKIANGLFVGSQATFGIHTELNFLDIQYYLALFPNWVKFRWIPIGTDGSGNYYLMPTAKEFGDGFPVMFVEATKAVDSPAYILASSLSYFLEFLLREELGASNWPFDRIEVVQKDPDIETFHNILLPWQA